MVTAAALATLAGLAPGRVSAAFGTGLTGRMLLGERPLAWAAVEEYVRTVRALLRAEEASWNGNLVRLSPPAGFTAALPADIAVLVAADGPRGRAVAARLGDGLLTTAHRASRAAGAARRQVLLAFGTVLDDGEDPRAPGRSRPPASPWPPRTTLSTSRRAPTGWTSSPAAASGGRRSKRSRRPGVTSRSTRGTW